MATSPGWKQNIFEDSNSKVINNASDDNERIALNRISKVSLARWIIFDTFIKVARSLNKGVLPGDIKYSWLLFQILPSSWDQDPFLALIDSCLVRASADQLRELNLGFTATTILESEFKSSKPSSDSFYYVLDEAQVAGHLFMGAFADAEGTRPRPVLCPIVRHLTSSPNSYTRVIISGTGFSPDLFKEVFTSGVGKVGLMRVHYATGEFIDPKDQLRYITQYIPSDFLQSPSGKSLVDRSYNWLRGRYVIPTKLLSPRLVDNFLVPGIGSLLVLSKKL